MAGLSPRFFSLLVVLLALGAFDLSTLLLLDSTTNGVGIGIRGAVALPVGNEALGLSVYPSKPRIGIVIKTNANLGGKEISAGSVPAAKRRGAFDERSIGSGVTLPLRRVDHSTAANPLMLLQHHINRANVRLATMRRSLPPSPAELSAALERRKESILSKRAFTPVAEVDVNVLSPIGAGRLLKVHKRQPIMKHGRLGFTVNPATHKAGNRRADGGLLGGFLDPLIGGGDPSTSSTDQVAANAAQDAGGASVPDSKPSISSSGSSSQHKAKPGFPSSASGSLSEAGASGSKEGYSQKALDAAVSGGLTKSYSPTAEHSLGLDIEANDVGYVAAIEIGSNKTQFLMLIDSGSADTWVPSTVCQNCGEPHQKLGKSVSTSFQSSSTKFSITYGTGAVAGTLATDDVYIAGMTLRNHTFGVAKQETKDFSAPGVPFDGLMGLALSPLSNQRVPTPIEALVTQGMVAQPVMGYRLARVEDGNDGEVTFGGVDAQKYVGNLTELDNVSKQGFWEGAMDSVKFNGQDLGLSGRTAILDTGTTLIVAPKADADAVHAAIAGSRSDGQGGYYIPCTTRQRLSLTFGGTEFTIDPRDLTFLPVNQDDLTGDCVSSISSGQVGEEHEWLVGATFLKNVYFATNAQTNTIGLAHIKQRPSVASKNSTRTATLPSATVTAL